MDCWRQTEQFHRLHNGSISIRPIHTNTTRIATRINLIPKFFKLEVKVSKAINFSFILRSFYGFNFIPQRSCFLHTPEMAILPLHLSILPNFRISELYGTLSCHVFEKTAEGSLIFKAQNVGNLFSAFAAVKQQAFGFCFYAFVNDP